MIELLQKDRTAAALHLAVVHDRNAVAQNVGLLQEVRGQQDGLVLAQFE